jgi:two-component system sensor histidine kinase CpxA
MTKPADTKAPGRQPKVPRVAFPLPAKILACFFLNLALLAGVAVYMARGQFRFGLDSLLTGSSGERIQRMSAFIISELNDRPREEWPAILKRFADFHQAQIAAVLNDGTRIAGTIMDPPEAVLKKLAEGSADPRRPPPPELRGPRGRSEGAFRPEPPPNGPPRDGPPGDPRRGPPPRPGMNGEFPPPPPGPNGEFAPPRDGARPPRPGANGDFPPPRDDAQQAGDDDVQHAADDSPATGGSDEEPPPRRADAEPPRDRRPPFPPDRPLRENPPPRPAGIQPGPPRDGRPPFPEGWPPSSEPPPQPPGSGPNGFPKFIVRAGEPPMYWIGIRTPLPSEDGRPGPPSTLLIAVPSLSSGGLLLDVTPWLWVGAGVLVCSVLMWLPLVRGITRSIRQMTGAAGQMAQGQFGTRVDTDRGDELGRLGESLNHMAGRLGEYVTGQKRFLGDIAHELCSPLARMEMALGVLEQRAAADQVGHVNDVREEVRHMSSLVNELLSFSKAGLRAKDLELRAVDLAALCDRVIQREGQGKTDIAVNVDAAMHVLADPDLLARAVGNVLRNAVRYAGDAGPVTISATVRGAEVLLAVTDSGPGVPSGTLHRLFDPFYRPETARTREGGGAGLGLAIVKSCVEACGGSAAVRNAVPRGLEVTMKLRRAAQA